MAPPPSREPSTEASTEPSAEPSRRRRRSGDLGRVLGLGLVAAPFVLFVVVSVLFWAGWAVNGRAVSTGAIAVAPLLMAGLTWAVSARRGNPPRDRLAPTLTAACATTAGVWGLLLAGLGA